jgi:hypothetical protein
LGDEQSLLPRTVANSSLIIVEAIAEWKNGTGSIQLPEYCETSQLKVLIPENGMVFFKLILSDFIIDFMIQESNRCITYYWQQSHQQLYFN